MLREQSKGNILWQLVTVSRVFLCVRVCLYLNHYRAQTHVWSFLLFLYYSPHDTKTLSRIKSWYVTGIETKNTNLNKGAK